ncbi:hypothetical protein PPSQR21_032850 [Paenibacillus polymyxa SQR-21]|nr:hypothetical protein PPSQR21_032850 [Paenibacillus polymyxa SQR-21]
MKITAVLLASVTLSFFGFAACFLDAYTFSHNNLGGVSLNERTANR